MNIRKTKFRKGVNMVPLAYEINKIVHIHLILPFLHFSFDLARKWSIFVFLSNFQSRSIYPKIIRFKLIEFILTQIYEFCVYFDISGHLFLRVAISDSRFKGLSSFLEGPSL